LEHCKRTDLIFQIISVFQHFSDATKDLSSESRPVLALAASYYIALRDHLIKFSTSAPKESFLAKAACNCVLEKYWNMSGDSAYAAGLGKVNYENFDIEHQFT